MNQCSHYEEWFLDGLYQELNEQEAEKLDQHLQECVRCSRHFRELQGALRMMDERERTAPPAGFWESFEASLGTRIATEPRRRPILFRPRTPDRVRESRLRAQRWAGRVAAAIALVAFGLFIGRWVYLDRPAKDESQLAQVDDATTALQQKLGTYMDQSQLLLLAIINFDAEAEGAETLDLEPQKRLSNQLISATPELKSELEVAGQRRLADLIGELEMILLQIANLEDTRGLNGLETLRQGVEKTGLLMRINLQRMTPRWKKEGTKIQQESARQL